MPRVFYKPNALSSFRVSSAAAAAATAIRRSHFYTRVCKATPYIYCTSRARRIERYSWLALLHQAVIKSQLRSARHFFPPSFCAAARYKGHRRAVIKVGEGFIYEDRRGFVTVYIRARARAKKGVGSRRDTGAYVPYPARSRARERLLSAARGGLTPYSIYTRAHRECACVLISHVSSRAFTVTVAVLSPPRRRPVVKTLCARLPRATHAGDARKRALSALYIGCERGNCGLLRSPRASAGPTIM